MTAATVLTLAATPPAPGFTLPIMLHAGAATSALLLGAVVLFKRKGTATHKLAGRVWVGLMFLTALSSLWIHGHGLPNIAGFSPIHLLSLWTFIALYQGVKAARAHNIQAHKRWMKNLYLYALILAGAFTLLPSRLLGWHLWTAILPGQ